ncbi:NAD(P)/FAD-dependent oxidoreductase [Marinomonas agarivorans]|nr:NAD(P)/FAD-dependent oxidoreductase [Marinomonas agarivorans]
MTAPCIIIGASHAAAQLSLNVRQQGWQGDIIVIGQESFLPYQRPPLSKTFLSGEKTVEDLLIKPESAYEKANVSFRLNTQVVEIDRQNKTVTLNNGDMLEYAKLALCTGATANPLPILGANLKGVHYLRNAHDAIALKSDISSKKHAVIIGGGFIGLEAAAALRQKAMHVTILEAQDAILQRVVSPEVAAFFTQLHESFGVVIRPNSIATSFEGSEAVTAVTCNNGEKIPADVVIIGIGVTPETRLAEQSGLTVKNGIFVNEFAQTNDPDIVAAGDCASYFHEIYQTDIRIESIQNALEQSKSAAASMNNKQIAFSSNIPRFWSDQYDIKLQICGVIDGYDAVEIEQDLEKRVLNALYFRKEKLIAAIAVNNPAWLTKVQPFIKNGEPVNNELIESMRQK